MVLCATRRVDERRGKCWQRRCALCIGALLLLGCGRAAYVEDGPCAEGEQRLSGELCGDEPGAELVEECHEGEWVLTEECRSEDECEEGSSRELKGHCGEFWYNKRIEVCRNGLLQEECACGAEDPVDFDRAAGPPYPPFWERLEPIPSMDFSGIKCADYLTAGSDYVFPDFVAGGVVTVDATMEFPKLRAADLLNLTGLAGEFEAVAHIEEVGTFQSLVSVEGVPVTGFEILKRLDSIHLYNYGPIELDEPHRPSYDSPLEVLAFSQFDSLESLSILHTNIVTLEGLSNLRTLRGDLELAFLKSEQPLLDLDGIESIGGNVTIHGQYVGMICDVRNWLDRRTIHGEVTVRNTPLADLPPCTE